jgi:hypothetical protein
MSRQGRKDTIQGAQQHASILVSLAIILTFGVAPAASRAETPVPAQATADDGAFLPYAPPPSKPGGLCLVDTGVNLNLDTEGVVVDRVAIDGGSGSDTSPTMHGTLLAMMAGARANDWGMIGTAPRAIQIVSVRILEPGQTTFPFSYYTDGITTCLQLQQQYNIKVIDLSLGSPNIPSSQDTQAITNALQQASNYGVAVVAAAGNDDGGQLDYPAAYSGVLSVAASDTQTGALCSFSNRGEGLRLIAPGCDLDGADPTTGEAKYNYWQGSSESSAIVASALDALVAYRGDLSPQAAEEDLTGAHSGTLDIAQAFRNAGLGQTVTEGEASEAAAKAPASASPAVSPQAVGPSGAMSLTSSFARPHARLKHFRGRTVLVLTARPSEAQTQLRYLARRSHSRRLRLLRTISGALSTITIPSKGVTEIAVRYTDPYDAERTSPWVTLTVHPTNSRITASRHAR